MVSELSDGTRVCNSCGHTSNDEVLDFTGRSPEDCREFLDHWLYQRHKVLPRQPGPRPMDLESTTKLITHLRAMGVRSFKDPASGLEVVFDREPAPRPGPAPSTLDGRDSGWGTWGPEPEKA